MIGISWIFYGKPQLLFFILLSFELKYFLREPSWAIKFQFFSSILSYLIMLWIIIYLKKNKPKSEGLSLLNFVRKCSKLLNTAGSILYSPGSLVRDLRTCDTIFFYYRVFRNGFGGDSLEKKKYNTDITVSTVFNLKML